MEDERLRTGKFSSNSARCVRLINRYWFDKGYAANARIEMKSKVLTNVDGHNYTIWFEEIVSDTVNGMPVNKIN